MSVEREKELVEAALSLAAAHNIHPNDAMSMMQMASFTVENLEVSSVETFDTVLSRITAFVIGTLVATLAMVAWPGPSQVARLMWLWVMAVAAVGAVWGWRYLRYRQWRQSLMEIEDE